MSFLLCIGILLLPWFPCVCGKCIFDQIQRSVNVVSPPTAQYASAYRFKTQRSKRHIMPMDNLQPIRIKIWIPSESPALSDWEREKLMSAVGEAVSEVSSLLSVKRVKDRLLLNRDVNKYCKFIWRNSSTLNHMKCGRAHENYRFESCLGVIIPDEHLDGCSVYPNPEHPVPTVLRPRGPGVPDADFLLYVFTHNTEKCRAESSVLAYTAHCQTGSDGRPLAGTMVICRETLKKERYTYQHFVKVTTVIHELFHVLGFSKELLSNWKDFGVDCWSHGQVTSTDQTGQVRLYSPTVIRAMQKHFNSTHTDLGAPLENKDAALDGLSSHWEARVLQGSIMAASLVEASLVRIDAITLAALQDTGWYSVNHSRAQSLVWGEGEGSDFGSVSACHNSSAFFCTGSGLGCHFLHLNKGECVTDQYLDGCHIFKPLANASECWIEDNARSGMNEGGGEIFGSDSRCFISNITRLNNVTAYTPVSGHCYRHRCTGINKYHIQVKDSDWMDCPAGTSIEVSGYQGFIFCPENRLCKYSDLAPPTSTQRTESLFSDTTAQSDLGMMEKDAAVQPSFTSLFLVSEAKISLAAVLSLMAVFALLSAAVLLYRKNLSVRVHAASYRTPLPHILYRN
uniref:Ciliated left-right organizer metallopeptidase n=1 Tax=Danio rerio TaxID=7955 RepID=CIROP_DANRE|nr:leishmanolysin-like peptidase [Danio rerio]A0A1D5NSK0.2 RecName: Full=Ciliated left-right organizer metallopeptidase; AltName: Full=Leishmanolysin-like peptidase 2; Flags: Precursor [Danio rerio]|eukprot:XP_021333818.1 leishmanolysin-like peptidase [Danio rerio]